jgi:hypothetical protein
MGSDRHGVRLSAQATPKINLATGPQPHCNPRRDLCRRLLRNRPNRKFRKGLASAISRLRKARYHRLPKSGVDLQELSRCACLLRSGYGRGGGYGQVSSSIFVLFRVAGASHGASTGRAEALRCAHVRRIEPGPCRGVIADPKFERLQTGLLALRIQANTKQERRCGESQGCDRIRSDIPETVSRQVLQGSAETRCFAGRGDCLVVFDVFHEQRPSVFDQQHFKFANV